MPQIGLKQYVDEVARAIEHRELDAAIEHCRHILGFYPCYLPVYRLLASASLEKGDYAHAAHFLQSLLSADPERADAWADLATLSDDLGELEQATWLMERAFEIEPGNAEIRERLRALYKRRDGIDHPRLKLTPGALGRMYAVGGFYRRAIYELQRLLESRAGLPPLHVAFLEVALVKAFWNADDMEAMAESVCQSLLGKLPNCLQANLVMGQILLSRGQAAEAESYLAVARSLDPEGRAARDLFGDQSPIPFEHIQILHLEPGREITVVEQPSAAAVPVEDTSWLDDVGEAFEAGIDLTALSEPEAEPQTPGWLEEWPTAETSPPAEAETSKSSTDQEQVGQAAPLPAWMTDLEPDENVAEGTELPAWLTDSDSVEDQPADVSGEEVELLPMPADEREQEAEEDNAELPAWLEELASEAEPAEELEAVSDEEPHSLVSPVQAGGTPEEEAEISEELAGELSADELPDWLRAFDERDIEETDEIEPVAPPSQTFDEELPDWMQVSTSEAEELGSEDEVEGGELPDWLRALGDTEQEITDLAFVEEESTEIVPNATLDEEELPDWLRELRTRQTDVEDEKPDTLEWMAEEDLEPESEIEAIDEDELPDWLRELRREEPVDEPLPAENEAPELEPSEEMPGASQAAHEIETLRDEELPEWLQALRAQEATPAQESTEPEELSVESALPDWLEEIEAETGPEVPTEALGEEELPDWLRELRAQEPALGDDTEQQALTSFTNEETPDWLTEIQAEGEAELPSEVVDEEELPDWLRELRAQEPGFSSGEQEAEGLIATVDEAQASSGPSEDEVESEAEPAPGLPAEQAAQEDLPDWLRALEAGDEESQTVAPELPAVTSAKAPHPPVEMPEPVEGMPSWLNDLEAEIAGQAVPGVQVELPTSTAEPAGAPRESIAEIGEKGLEVPETEAELLDTAEEASLVDTELTVTAEEELEAEFTARAEEMASVEVVPSVEAMEEPDEAVSKVEAEALVDEEEIEAPEAKAIVETSARPEPEAEHPPEAEETTEAQQLESVAEMPSDSEPEEAIVPEESVVADTEQEPEAKEPEPATLPDVGAPTEKEPATVQMVEPGATPPEALHEGDLQEKADEEPDWVHDLEAPAVTSEAEAAAETPELVQVEDAAPAPAAERDEVVMEESDAAPAPAGIAKTTEHLTQARAYLGGGALDEAANEYEQLVDTSSLQPEILQDLEQAVTAHPNHAALQRVLGDVYMRVGQLQKALQAYRQALQKLS